MNKYSDSISEIKNYVSKNYPDFNINIVGDSLMINPPIQKYIYEPYELSTKLSYDMRIKYEEELEHKRKKDKEERKLNINKYLNEFNLLNHKTIHKMKDFKDDELFLWKIILREIYSGWDPNENIDSDLFGKDDYEDHYNEEIQITKWIWKHDNKINILIDMYGYPGDNQSGGIFLNNKIVLINSDQEINSNKNTPKELIERISSFTHVRMQQCVEDKYGDPNPNAHKHCLDIRSKLDY
jgi:hypothetical protein